MSKPRDMLKMTNPWIYLLIGYGLITLTAFEFNGLTFVYPSIIAFSMGLYFMLRDDTVQLEELKEEPKEDESLTILKKRHTKGEITSDEFEHMKRELSYLENEREKKQYSVKELNKINELRWKENNPVEKEFQNKIQAEIKALRESNVDEEEIEQVMLSQGCEGKNIDENGKPYWVCGHCSHKGKV